MSVEWMLIFILMEKDSEHVDIILTIDSFIRFQRHCGCEQENTEFLST